MDELRWAFLVLGGLAIVGILVHGMWSVRKNGEGKQAPQLEPRESFEEDTTSIVDHDMVIDENDPLLSDDAIEPGHFDDLGLGEVRVVSRAEEAQEAGESNEQPEEVAQAQESPAPAEEAEPVEEAVPAPKIYSSVVSQPKPEYVAEQQAIERRAHSDALDGGFDIPEPPPSLLKAANRTEPTLGESPETPAQDAQEAIKEQTSAEGAKPSLADQAMNLVKRKKAEPTKKRREPKVREDQMRIDFDEPQMSDSPAEKNAPAPEKTAQPAQQEVLVLNVKAPDEQPIQGSALLPMLLTLGFKFGDQDIFHRHVNSNGKGPVLFSLANMFKPGVFDIDNLENFTTQGVSLFMILPIEGDPHQVFNMMHNAARKIADEFSAQVMDGRRSALTKQSLQQYVEKIREFERQRMIAR